MQDVLVFDAALMAAHISTFESQHRRLCLENLLSHITQLVYLLCIQKELGVL